MSTQSADDASKAQSRKRRHRIVEQELDRRAARALSLVQKGELSSGRQALEGASLAPGTRQTLEALRDPIRRPPVPRDPLPPTVVEHMPDVRFSLEEHRFAAILGLSRRGAAAGLSGMTTDHFRPLLDHVEDTRLFFLMGEQVAQARVPPTIQRFHSSRKNDCTPEAFGWRERDCRRGRGPQAGGTNDGQQFSKAVETATAPHQYAMSTRAGTECVAHVLQVLTEIDPQATIVSIDGVGAYDSISRKAMLEALIAMPGGSEALSFVRSFYGQPSRYVWEDEFGEVHHIDQGEGGEQGDALMPLLFSLGQHMQLWRRSGHDCSPERGSSLSWTTFTLSPLLIGSVSCTTTFCKRSCIGMPAAASTWGRLRFGMPLGTGLLFAIFWRGSHKLQTQRRGCGRDLEFPWKNRGVRILGTPLGHPHYVQAFLRRVTAEHEVLLSRIPLVEDVQSAWALLLHCVGGRANYMLRAVRLEMVRGFAEGHNAGLWTCLCNILNVVGQDVATMPLSLGGLGLRDAVRTSPPAFWCRADCIAMVRARHPDVAALIIRSMRDPTGPPILVSGNGQRPPRREPEEFEPGGCRHGWQHEAASRVERQHRGRLMPRLPQQQRAMLRSQSGPLAGVPLSTTPCNFLSRIDSHLFRVLLLRRFRLPLPLSARQCRCGRPLDTFGHHRTSCAGAGVLGRRGFAVESAGARICREA